MASGVRLDEITGLLAGCAIDLATPLSVDRVTHGHSNLTYIVSAADGRRVVIRRPPRGDVLERAHDVLREARIMTALRGSGVPVPQVLGTSNASFDDQAPAFVMTHVEGVAPRDRADVERWLPQPGRAVVGDALVDVLATLHAVVPESVGLADLGRRDGYVERQLRRWRRQIDDGGSVPPARLGLLHQAHEALADRVPVQLRSAIVHGDFKLDNCLVCARGRVTAVLDWELCTLGDPLADLGGLIVYWDAHRDGRVAVLSGPTAAEGFASSASLAERYARASGAALDDLPFYVAFASWRLACILEGVHARYAAGQMQRPMPPELVDFDSQSRALAEPALRLGGRRKP